MTQVAYVGSTVPGVFAGRWEMLQQLTPDSLELRQVDPDLSDGEMIEALAGVEAVIAFPPKFSTAVAEQCPDLKFIQALAAGYEDIDVAAMNRLGISVANNGGFKRRQCLRTLSRPDAGPLSSIDGRLAEHQGREMDGRNRPSAIPG